MVETISGGWRHFREINKVKDINIKNNNVRFIIESSIPIGNIDEIGEILEPLGYIYRYLSLFTDSDREIINEFNPNILEKTSNLFGKMLNSILESMLEKGKLPLRFTGLISQKNLEWFLKNSLAIRSYNLN